MKSIGKKKGSKISGQLGCNRFKALLVVSMRYVFLLSRFTTDKYEPLFHRNKTRHRPEGEWMCMKGRKKTLRWDNESPKKASTQRDFKSWDELNASSSLPSWTSQQPTFRWILFHRRAAVVMLFQVSFFFLRSVHTPPKSRKRWRCELGKGSDTLKHSRLNGT